MCPPLALRDGFNPVISSRKLLHIPLISLKTQFSPRLLNGQRGLRPFVPIDLLCRWGNKPREGQGLASAHTTHK